MTHNLGKIVQHDNIVANLFVAQKNILVVQYFSAGKYVEMQCAEKYVENDFFPRAQLSRSQKGMEKIHYYVDHKRSFLLYLKKKKRVAEGIVSHRKKKGSSNCILKKKR